MDYKRNKRIHQSLKSLRLKSIVFLLERLTVTPGHYLRESSSSNEVETWWDG